MELVKESSAVSCLPDISCSCFFHQKQEYCALASAEKKLYCAGDCTLKVWQLQREYPKLIPCCNVAQYLAYSGGKQNSECILYFLEENLKEYDLRRLRTEENKRVEDMWLDQEKQLLYLVFSSSIQRYNLNGDYLGVVMKSPCDTCYKAVCTVDQRFFLAYEKQGCAYVAEYDQDGIYIEALSIGSGFYIGNMEIFSCERYIRLHLYGKRQGQFAVCLEFSIKKRTETEDISVELVPGEGIGETTCYLDCQTGYHDQ